MGDTPTPERCCAKFAEAIDSRGGNIEFDEFRAEYHVLGCCQNCYVLQYLTHCPFCGKALPMPDPVPVHKPLDEDD